MRIIEDTQAWVQKFVVGLNLCPFAKPVLSKGLIRYVVCEETEQGLITDTLDQELLKLRAIDPEIVETTLFILPNLCGDFLDFHFLVEACKKRIKALDLIGIIQIADFHPEYEFADARREDISNATNQSPYPMLHLLREASVERARQNGMSAELIVKRNLALLNELGSQGVRKILDKE